ncbi:MAG: transcriptional repressor [Anaerolineales bacterium]|nr:transcriptional repressor [Anaerolineales bacterium]
MATKTSSPCPENKQDWLDCLKASGYRLTSPRRAVVETLANSQRALNATEIYDLAREQYPSLGLVSVYRTLEKLEQLELIQRVHHPDGCQAFIAGFTGHQHLLICQSCGKAEFFEGDNLEMLFERVAQESGYQIQEHWLQFFGFCSKCRTDKD